MNGHDPRAVGAQVRLRGPGLTRLEEARAVDALAGRHDLSEATPLREVAEGAGVCVAVSSHAGTPWAEVADVVPLSTPQGSPLPGGNAAARVAQLGIMGAPFVADLAQTRRAAGAERGRSRGP